MKLRADPQNVSDTVPTPDAPAFADLEQLGRWLREKKTSPTRLAAYFLDRLERLGPKYNALVTITRDRAMREAKRAEEELRAGNDRGRLHGIAYGVKDLLATKDAPTSWGAAPYRQQQFGEDATVIRRLADAGAVLVAKLAMVELAGGMGYRQADASFTGPGLNPWDRTKWSGGSSTGPGAAVAAGLVPFAIGSETWGSILTPATFCGITGLRPTYGRVSRHGAMALSWTMDKLGPMTRTVQDADWVLGAIAGPDASDPTTLPGPYGGMAPMPAGKVSLAVFKNAESHLQPDVAANYRRSLEVLREFAEFTEVDLPTLPFNPAADIILSAELASSLEELIGTQAALHLKAPEDRIGGIADQYIFAKDYLRALRIRGRAIRVLDEWLKPYAALVAPSLATVAYPIETPFSAAAKGYRAPEIGGPGNLAGLPAIGIPNGFGEHGLPTGIQFVGRAMTESTILRVAHELQRRTPWHRKYPKVEP
jgi:aspartyl-tRNA(Asn)/glutamyl-tRNA(Gln) amidotransferase subunit A